MQPETFRGHIRRLRRRVRVLLMERGMLFGGSIGLVAASIMAAASPSVPVLLDYSLWAGVVLLGLAAGACVGLFRRVTDLAVALAADERTGLKERISTAAVIPGEEPRDIERAVVSDAESHLDQFRPAEVFPHKWGRPHKIFGICLLLAAAVFILPQLPQFQTKAHRRDAAAMKPVGKKLVKTAKEIKRLTSAEHKEYRKLAKKMADLGRKMQTGRMTRKTAMLQAMRLNKDLKQAQDKLAMQHYKDMQAARMDMHKAAEDIAKRVARDIAKSEKISQEAAMKKLASDSQLSRLANKSGELTSSEKSELARALSKYASDPSISIPKELAEALARLAQSGDFQKAAELARQIAQKLNYKGGGKMPEIDRKMLEQQMKALAEALKGTDLDELAALMREDAEELAKMSPEELKELMAKLGKEAKLKGKGGGFGFGLLPGPNPGFGLGGLSGAGQLPGGGTGLSGAGLPGGSPGAGSAGSTGGASGTSGLGGNDANTGPRGKLHNVSETVKASSLVGDSGMIYMGGETQGAPDAPGESKVPYTAVLPDARKAAESAISKDKIPAAYRKTVKDYFNSLQ